MFYRTHIKQKKTISLNSIECLVAEVEGGVEIRGKGD